LGRGGPKLPLPGLHLEDPDRVGVSWSGGNTWPDGQKTTGGLLGVRGQSVLAFHLEPSRRKLVGLKRIRDWRQRKMKRCPHCGRTDCAVHAEDGEVTELCSVTGKVIPPAKKAH